ncbi:MAG: 1-phosphofructokinase family hexose kinase [Solirubrobacteraceae bacterium]
MIVTVTLNPALDRTLEVPSFTPGRRHRSVDQHAIPGGKGINVARALMRLGQPVIACGLIGGANGTRIVEALADESVLSAFVRIHEESRTNMAVIDPTTGTHTEINERGPTVTEHEMRLFEQKLTYLARGASVCVFAGSLPPGVEPDIYVKLIKAVRKLGVLTVVDTDGEPLKLAVRAEPDVVSPNELEAEDLVGYEFGGAEDRMRAVVEIARQGPAETIMTVPDGCYARILEDGEPALYRVTIEPLEAQSPIGSGDAFLAGYVAARYQGRNPVDCLRFGVACGAESTQHMGAGIIDPATVYRLLEGVVAERVELSD